MRHDAIAAAAAASEVRTIMHKKERKIMGESVKRKSKQSAVCRRNENEAAADRRLLYSFLPSLAWKLRSTGLPFLRALCRARHVIVFTPGCLPKENMVKNSVQFNESLPIINFYAQG